MKNKTIVCYLLLFAFLIVSYIFIIPKSDSDKKTRQSTILKTRTIQQGDIERIDYIDENGNLVNASDKGYASIQISKSDRTTMERYFDANGKKYRTDKGYYGVLRNYNEQGYIIQITYCDLEDKPIVTSEGYAIEKREYDGAQKTIIKYYDADDNPVRCKSHEYGRIIMLDDQGEYAKTTFIDSGGNSMKNTFGYATVIHRSISKNGLSENICESEFFYDDKGQPIELSIGQQGVYTEYDKEGRAVLWTFLDTYGEKIKTKKGYTTVQRIYDNNSITEKYYDIEGNPISLSEGQYGIRIRHDNTIYLDKNGNEIFNIRNLLYNQSWLVIVLGLALMVLSEMANRKMNALFACIYIFVILYFTLLYRYSKDNSGFELLSSYKKILYDSKARADILKNIWLFIPFGTILYRLIPQKTILVVPIVLSITIEGIQFFSNIGLCELDDIISNSLGSGIGFAIGKLTLDLFSRIKTWIHIHITE